MIWGYKYISIVYKMSTSSIADMIEAKLIKINDEIEFKFKGNIFTAKIIKGGLITSCTFKSCRSTVSIECLNNVIAFSSLTAWTEACLQDVLEEYYTRYSSWKRVIHKPSSLTMSELRDRCKLQHTKIDPDSYKEIYRLNTIIDSLKKYITDNNLELPEIKNDFAISLTPKRKILKLNIKNEEAFKRVQKRMIQELNG